MFSSRRSYNFKNRIHERSLRTVYNDTSSTFQEPLQRKRSVSSHHKDIQTLITEVLKVVNNICPPIMKTFFDFKEQIQHKKISRNETVKCKNCPIWSRNSSLPCSSTMVSCSGGFKSHSLTLIYSIKNKALEMHWIFLQIL